MRPGPGVLSLVVLLVSSAARADPVSLPSMGLNVDLPAGWTGNGTDEREHSDSVGRPDGDDVVLIRVRYAAPCAEALDGVRRTNKGMRSIGLPAGYPPGWYGDALEVHGRAGDQQLVCVDLEQGASLVAAVGRSAGAIDPGVDDIATVLAAIEAAARRARGQYAAGDGVPTDALGPIVINAPGWWHADTQEGATAIWRVSPPSSITLLVRADEGTCESWRTSMPGASTGSFTHDDPWKVWDPTTITVAHEGVTSEGACAALGSKAITVLWQNPGGDPDDVIDAVLDAVGAQVSAGRTLVPTPDDESAGTDSDDDEGAGASGDDEVAAATSDDGAAASSSYDDGATSSYGSTPAPAASTDTSYAPPARRGSVGAPRVLLGLAELHHNGGNGHDGFLIGTELPERVFLRHLAVEGAASYRYAGAGGDGLDLHAGFGGAWATGPLVASWMFGLGFDSWGGEIALSGAPDFYTGPRLRLGNARYALDLQSTSVVRTSGPTEWRLGVGVVAAVWTHALSAGFERIALGDDRALSFTLGLGL